jgi:ubiquinone/menaquinone biosynthesis C-methylase UbiE
MSVDRRLYSKLRRDAESNYSPTIAAAYREEDEAARHSVTHAGKCEIIRDVSQRFDRPIDILDLGCGTGRYFHCADNVNSLVGVDPSEHMLRQAREPVLGGNRNVRLIRSTLHEIAFRPHSFDLVICVGVLGMWCPLDGFVLRRVASMLRLDGVVFLTANESTPDHVTLKRRIATAIQPLLFGAARRYVDFRLHDITVPEQRLRTLGEENFAQVTITKWQSPTMRSDLHCIMTQPRWQQT